MKDDRNIENKFFYTRTTRIAATATLVAYFTFIAAQSAMVPLALGLLTTKVGDFSISFPASSLISLLVGAILYLSLAEFLNYYFKIVSERKLKRKMSIPPRLLSASIVTLVTFGTFYFAKYAISSNPNGLTELFGFTVSVPVLMSIVLGLVVFTVCMVFYNTIEGITPKKAGRIISEILFSGKFEVKK